MMLDRLARTLPVIVIGLAALFATAVPVVADDRPTDVPASVRGRGGAGSDRAAADAYAKRAYPATFIAFAQQRRAASAAETLKGRPSTLTARWEAIGPSTLDVDPLVTESFQVPTQWSGRQTAMAVAPTCTLSTGCTLYIGAAGGGVWRTPNALAPTPAWKFISGDIPTNAIGSIAIDPNDPTGQTIYVGTGEGNGSGDSEVGLGLYKTTNGGAHWSVVAGSVPIASQRAISAVAIDPTDPNHILMGTTFAVTGLSSTAGAAQPLTSSQSPGCFESYDGGATFTRRFPLSRPTYEIQFDPSDANVVYAAIGGLGLWRLSNVAGAPALPERIFSSSKTRFTFSPVRQANGRTRIYLADSEPDSQVYRVDDASQPSEILTGNGNSAWTRLSSSTKGTPGFGSYRYCEGQCFYNMKIASPAGRPDMVVLGGTNPVRLSTDAGAMWTDQRSDIAGETVHPDQHAIGFVPGSPDIMFIGSDGGVIRTSGIYVDGTRLCTARAPWIHRDDVTLTGVDLTQCNC